MFEKARGAATRGGESKGMLLTTAGHSVIVARHVLIELDQGVQAAENPLQPTRRSRNDEATCRRLTCAITGTRELKTRHVGAAARARTTSEGIARRNAFVKQV